MPCEMEEGLILTSRDNLIYLNLHSHQLSWAYVKGFVAILSEYTANVPTR